MESEQNYRRVQTKQVQEWFVCTEQESPDEQEVREDRGIARYRQSQSPPNQQKV